MRLWWGPALLILLLPGAGAAVNVESVEVPERTMAGKPFLANVTLANDADEERRVFLFAALYSGEAGATDCGPATDPRFKRFTHLVQERVRIPPRSTIVYPDADDQWLHLYHRQDVDAAPSTAEFCVFVANASQGQAIDYEDYASLPLSVRGVNAKPTASFAWDPERPRATADVRFRAEGSDPDGDPVAFTWDFGHVNASGRARAAGGTATTFFYPAGDYVVTLTASDGLEETQVSRTVTVAAADAAPPRERPFDVPLAPWMALVALALACARRR